LGVTFSEHADSAEPIKVPFFTRQTYRKGAAGHETSFIQQFYMEPYVGQRYAKRKCSNASEIHSNLVTMHGGTPCNCASDTQDGK
jgi:hypothetical protein